MGSFKYKTSLVQVGHTQKSFGENKCGLNIKIPGGVKKEEQSYLKVIVISYFNFYMYHVLNCKKDREAEKQVKV